MIEPSVSEPIANGTSPAATALAEPAEEPLLPCSGLYGLRVLPPCQRSPMASAPTTFGAKPYEAQRWDVEAACLSKLKEAGAVLCAKLSLVALAFGSFVRSSTYS